MMHKILLCVIGLSALAKCRTAAVETSSVAWMDVIEAEKGGNVFDYSRKLFTALHSL